MRLTFITFLIFLLMSSVEGLNLKVFADGYVDLKRGEYRQEVYEPPEAVNQPKESKPSTDPQDPGSYNVPADEMNVEPDEVQTRPKSNQERPKKVYAR